MWFPDAPLLRVGLSQHGLTIARSARLGLGAVPPAERLDCSGAARAGEPWRAAVERLAEWLAAQKGQRFKVCVVLSGRFVRWQLLPWRAELSGRSERRAFAALRFREVFGKTAEAWNIRPASLAPGYTAPAGAVDDALVAALHAACQEHGSQLQQLTPYFSAAFDTWRSAIRGSTAWFATLESDTLTVGLLANGQWLALQSHKLAGDWREPLRALMVPMAMASGQDAANAPLYLAGDLAQAPAPQGLAFTWLSPKGRQGGTEVRAVPGLRLALGH